MTYIIRYLIPLIYLLTGSISIMALTKRKLKDCIPLIFFVTPFLLYISVLLLNTFDFGMIAAIVLSVIGMIIAGKERKEILKKDNLETILFFLGIYTFFFLYDWNRSFSMWDEWSHWGEMVKEMFRIDNLYSVPESTLMVHKDYPPLVTIYELFMIKLTGIWKESTLIHSLHVMEFSLFLPFLEKIKSKAKYFVPILMLVIINFFDHHHVINSIYLDYLLSIIVVYILGIILFEKKSAWKQGVLLLSILFLILTKEISILFYPLIIGIYFGKEILEKYSLKELVIDAILLVVIPLTVYFSYQQYKNHLEVEKQFEVNSSLLSELIKEKEAYQIETLENYKEALWKKNITNSYLPISFLLSVIILGIVLYKVIPKKQEKILVLTFLLLEIVGYIVVLLILYMFRFGRVEGPSLASFDRYMATLLLIPALLILLYHKVSWKKEGILLLLLLCLQVPKSIRTLVPAIKGYTFEYVEHAKIIKESVKEEKSVFLLAEETNGEYQYPVKFYANPIRTNKEYFEWKENPSEEEKRKLNNYLKQYDYFYLIRVRDSTKKDYSEYLEKIEEKTVYKIQKGKEKITFEKVEKVN